jgi:hypothetical protein
VTDPRQHVLSDERVNGTAVSLCGRLGATGFFLERDPKRGFFAHPSVNCKDCLRALRRKQRLARGKDLRRAR